jgi:hypothetical protein
VDSGEKMRFSPKDVGVDIRPVMTHLTYGQSVTGKPYFHQPSHSSCLLVIELCFSRNRIDDKSFLSIRGYGASRELHGGALWPGCVQTHMDALLLLSLHCTYFLYIKHAYFATLMKYILELRGTLFCENVCLLTR